MSWLRACQGHGSYHPVHVWSEASVKVLNFLAPLCNVYVTVVGRSDGEHVSTAVRSGDEDWSYGERYKVTQILCALGYTRMTLKSSWKLGQRWIFFLFYWGRCQVSSWDLWTYFSVWGCPFRKGIQWTVLGFWFAVTGWLVFWLWETIEAFFFFTLKGRWATGKQLWRCYPFSIGSYFCDLIMSSEVCCWLWSHSLPREFLDLSKWI